MRPVLALDSDTVAAPPWLDTESILSASLRSRIGAARDAARDLQRAADRFATEHGAVFRDYALAADDADVPHDVWEVLDQASGYAALWITVLATEATLSGVLEVPTPAMITPPAETGGHGGG